MELSVMSTDGQSKHINVSDTNFKADFNQGLVHQVVTAYMAASRSGNSAQKTRSEVRGGGKKPWKQKGTGRARAGTIRSPIWRSGGVTFAAKPRCYEQKVNKKMYRAALRSIFSELVRQDRLILVDELKLEEAKTKALITKLKQFNIDKSVLVVTLQHDPVLALAGRNLHTVGIFEASEIGPVHLLQFDKVLMTSEALKSLEERLA